MAPKVFRGAGHRFVAGGGRQTTNCWRQTTKPDRLPHRLCQQLPRGERDEERRDA